MGLSPAVARWELARRLRQRRLELGIGSASLTRVLDVSPAYWSHIENERNLLPKDKLDELLEVLDLGDAERDELHALRDEAKGRGWWSGYTALFGDELLRYYGMEWGARSIRTYEGIFMPGLLQSEEYSRALMEAAAAVIPAKEVAQRVEVRRRRQERLDGDDRVEFIAVISEAVLTQQFGGPGVLHRQLCHLAEVVRSHPDNVDLRVIPFAASNILGGTTFHLLDFASPRLPTLGWIETSVFGQLLVDGPSKKESKVRDLGFVHHRGVESALGREETLGLIDETAARLESSL
ncbi:DUF5753 domain-containing protein [Nocardia sp. NPDC052566]|uniref:DUF5753 domain-containing protein n=1 Tax=Nocardia sp. NPDC052566 TaxID=3364330 RepID=UPI0037C8E49E